MLPESLPIHFCVPVAYSPAISVSQYTAQTGFLAQPALAGDGRYLNETPTGSLGWSRIIISLI